MTIFSKTALISLYDLRKNTLHGNVDAGIREATLDASEGSHVSAITGLLGEDLVLGLFKHYWENQNAKALCEITRYQCRVGEANKLDAVLTCTSPGWNVIFQTEVKNWSRHSVGPKYNLPLDVDNDQLINRSISIWTGITERAANIPTLEKVTYKNENAEMTPLLCMWMPLQTETADGAPFFQISEDHQYLPNVWVFSASIYLRGLNCDRVDIHTPRLAHRMEMLKQLILCQ